MTSTHANTIEVHWTPLGDQLGYTNSPTARAAILTATRQIDWRAANDHTITALHGPAVRALVTAATEHDRSPNRATHLGAAALTLPGMPCRQLVGLAYPPEQSLRLYLLDLSTEAACVLITTTGAKHRHAA